jgi:4'-phosphopantetheinyl transferase
VSGLRATHDEDEAGDRDVTLPVLVSQCRSAHADVWLAQLDAPADAVAALEAVLDERERLDAATRTARGRRRYVVAHAAQRAALAAVLGCAADAVPLVTGPRGRTHVAVDAPPHVNLTHSGELALVVTSRDAAVGIDVEKHAGRRAIDALARRALSPAEHEAFLAAPVDDRLRAFHRLWVRKEALLKMSGRGIAGLRDVTATPPPPGCTIEDLAVGAEASAAVAAACSTLTITWHEWDVPSLLAAAAGG